MEYLMFETTIKNFLTLSGFNFDCDVKANINGEIDFVAEFNNKVYGFTLKQSITATAIDKLNSYLNKHIDIIINEYILVTVENPSTKQLERFHKNTTNNIFNKVWCGLNNLPQLIGMNKKINFKSPKTLAFLQTASVSKNIKKYMTSLKNKPININFDNPNNFFTELKSLNKDKKIFYEYTKLNRQFSYPTIAKLYESKEDLNKLLKIGNKSENSIVILSDIKNFSTITTKVAKKNRDFIYFKETMGKYYQKARELVWKYGGTFDKFIGDAVLAIFNYPFNSEEAHLNAVNYAKELIKIGEETIGKFAYNLKLNVETGTRVGMSSGEIWVLNLNYEELEVAFIGNVINITARLEKACETNGILICNDIKEKLESTNSQYFSELKLTERILEGDDIKGQTGEFLTWQIEI